MGFYGLLGDVIRENKKACILVGCFVALEVVLLVPTYGTEAPEGLGFLIMLITAATLLNRYFWIRMFRPFLQVAGAPLIERGSGECCCCCLCRKQDGSQVRWLRAFFVFVVIVNYAVAISSVAFEQILSTTNGEDPHPWVYFSFQWAGGFVLFIVSAWFVDLFVMSVRVVLFCRRRLIRSPRGGGDEQKKFRLPLWAFPLMWLVTWVVLVSVSSVKGVEGPITKTVEVPLANLPTCLDGYSLAVISDIHAGPTVGKAEVERHVKAINALGADAIVLLGDLVDDQVEDIGSIVNPISGFSAPDGQFFVLGNHEEYTGEPEKWADFVSDRGFTVLNDARVTLPPGAKAAGSDGCYFYLAGVNDFESDPDYDIALNGRDESIATVLLAHEPIQVHKASEYSVGLQLSGHSHGGQVFPYHAITYLNQGYLSGLHKKDDTFLYVSEGAIGWGPRMRLLSTTEYTLVILRSPELFTEADTSSTESSRAGGAAGVLLILTFIYCLGYPVIKAFQRAKLNKRDDVEFGGPRAGEASVRRRVVAGTNAG